MLTRFLYEGREKSLWVFKEYFKNILRLNLCLIFESWRQSIPLYGISQSNEILRKCVYFTFTNTETVLKRNIESEDI